MITHEGCTEEFEADFFPKLSPEDRAAHLRGFAFMYHYKEEDLDLKPYSAGGAENYALLLDQHCGAHDFTEQFFPLFDTGKPDVYIGSHGCSPC